MKLLTVPFVCSIIFSVLAVSPITAQADEVRIGVMAHDVNALVRRSTVEESVSVTGEYVFETPSWLEWAFSPRPYLYGAANLDGNTSHGGIGLNWRSNIGGNFYAEFGTGLSLHNGTNRIDTSVPSGLTAAELENLRIQLDNRFATEIEFGSSVLFRNQVAIGYKFNDTWSADVVLEHLSHGQIIGGPENDGLDSVGLRLSRKF